MVTIIKVQKKKYRFFLNLHLRYAKVQMALHIYVGSNLKVYIANAGDSIYRSVSKSLENNVDCIVKHITTRDVDKISPMLGESVLLIGGICLWAECAEVLEKIRSKTNIPVAFVLSAAASDEENRRSLSASDEQVVVVREGHSLSDSINKFYTDSLNTIIRRKIAVKADISVDLDNMSCKYLDHVIPLTRTEMSILYYLIISDGVNVSHEELMAIFHIQGKRINANTLASHVRNIKNKVSKFKCDRNLILSVYGYGYRLQ